MGKTSALSVLLFALSGCQPPDRPAEGTTRALIGGVNVSLSNPVDIAVDGVGNVYVLDAPVWGGASLIQIRLDGTVSTVADLSTYGASNGMIGNPNNNDIYIALPTAVLQFSLAGVQVLAGDPASGGDVDGDGAVARFDLFGGISIDSAGNLYVVSTSNGYRSKRMITPDGTVSTVLRGTVQYPTSGYALTWSAVDAAGARLYDVSDWADALSLDFTTSFAGSGCGATVPCVPPNGGGYADGTGSAATFNYPQGIAVDLAGNIFVADTGNNNIRKVTPGAVVTTYAGSALALSGWVDGPAASARFNQPFRVAVDVWNNVYVLDKGNLAIRKITPGGIVTTIASGCAGMLYCGICVESDHQNCGACGHACSSTQTCTDAVCVACPSGQHACDNSCTDLSTDPNNCGGCGNVCPFGICQAGQCTCGPYASCSGSCVDLGSDPYNCGACGNVCPVGGSCDYGRCTCPSGYANCGGTCVDLTSDPTHCGSCTRACSAAQICGAGQCHTCPAGELGCDGQCIDTQSDWYNCGACNHACSSGELCAAGTCLVPLQPVILSITKLSSGAMQLELEGSPFVRYDIQASGDLTTWRTIGSASADGTGIFFYTDTQAEALSQRFYRASVEVLP